MTSESSPRPLSVDLVAAYCRTSYWVETPQEYLRLRLGQRCETLERRLIEHDAEHGSELQAAQGAERRAEHGAAQGTIITACNPYSEPASPSQNRGAMQSLAQELARRGLATWPVVGVGDDGAWPPEASFLAVGVGRNEAGPLGRMFRQRAVVIVVVGQLPELAFLGGEADRPALLAASNDATIDPVARDAARRALQRLDVAD